MELIIFGNPKGGTPLIQERRTAGIDLPVKALAWQDSEGKVWLTYNDARWLAKRHKIGGAEATIEAIEKGMSMMCRAAAGA